MRSSDAPKRGAEPGPVTGPTEDLTTTALRGAGLLLAAGTLLGGVAGTADWPLVGTFFGAIEGGSAGAVVGVVVGVVLGLLVRREWPPWSFRLTSAALGGATAVAGAAAYHGPLSVPRSITATILVAAVVLTGYLGPLIATGLEPAAARRAYRIVARAIGAGCWLGAAAGGIVGLAIGVSSYLPTAAFALLEGAVLGAVSGGVLGLLSAAVAVLPRLHARP